MNNRAVILKAAMELFAYFGYEATGIQEICDASEITKPTLYYYFKNKNGLIETLLRENYQSLILRLTDAAEYHNDLTLNLEQVMRTYLQFASENPVFFRLQLSMQFSPTRSDSYQVIVPWVLKQHAIIEEMFLKAENDHGNMKGRAQTYTTTLLGLVNTYAMRALDHKQEFSDELLFQVRHQFMHGIFS